MSGNSSQALGDIQLPQCPVCNLQPIPQSVQFVPFVMLQVFLAFISLKLFAIFLLFSYSFPRSAWYCPQCQRQVQVEKQVEGISENLIIRMGNCMFMLSKFKFRVLAVIIASYVLYLFILEVHNKPKLNIEKTWISLATNCGYQAFLQNSYKANTMYAEYPQLGEWTIAGIYLKQQQVNNKVRKIFLKMNPTQFKDPMTEDVAVVVTAHTSIADEKMELGDVVEVKGQWEGRQSQGHAFKFLALKIHKVGTKISPTDAKLLSITERFIRLHEQQKVFISKQQHQKLTNEKIANLTKSK